MKKFLAIIVAIVMLLGFAGCETGKIEIPENVEDAQELIMASEFEKNKLRAEKTYVGTWAVFSGALDGIYEDHFYITATFGASSKKVVRIKCTIKADEVRQALLNLNEGDVVETTAIITGLSSGGVSYILNVAADAYILEKWQWPRS